MDRVVCKVRNDDGDWANVSNCNEWNGHANCNGNWNDDNVNPNDAMFALL